MNFIGIIPARFASTRFPGKPLVDICGKSMIERVYEQASKLLQHVYVATDDERIANAVIAFGGKVVFTSVDHKSGTDRCNEAIQKIQETENIKFDVIINIQGDEPFIQPEQLQLLKDCFNDSSVEIATLAKPITDNEEVFNPNNVKLVKNIKGFALYFSRNPMPYLRGVDENKWATNHEFLKHIGLYAYRTKVLSKITTLEQSSLEKAESLEQNRWLENGYSVFVKTCNFENIAIDTPEDLEKAIVFFQSLK